MKLNPFRSPQYEDLPGLAATDAVLEGVERLSQEVAELRMLIDEIRRERD